MTLFDPGEMPYNIACEVKNFDPQDYMDRKVARRITRATQFAIAVTHQALTDAKLTIDESNRDNVGVLMATGGVESTRLNMQPSIWWPKAGVRLAPLWCRRRWPTRSAAWSRLKPAPVAR
ncbi:MAG: beta-ketoacyl synthase N-terminal-like domain-containing protein [Caldilineaceae bacterium]